MEILSDSEQTMRARRSLLGGRSCFCASIALAMRVARRVCMPIIHLVEESMMGLTLAWLVYPMTAPISTAAVSMTRALLDHIAPVTSCLRLLFLACSEDAATTGS